MSTTAERLAEAMESRGVDQKALAAELGVAQGTISKIVVGRTANSRLIPRIAVHLGVSVPWLLGESDDPDAGSTAARTLNYEQLELIDCFDRLSRADQQALLQIARSMAGHATPSARVHSPPVGFRAETADRK